LGSKNDTDSDTDPEKKQLGSGSSALPETACVPLSPCLRVVFRRWAMVIVAGFFLFTGIASALAGERILVKPIEVKALEAMIKATPGPLLAVAMASWCAPCLKEIPSLNKLAATYGPKGLKIIGISVDMDDPAPMQEAADKLKVAFPIYWVGEPGLAALKIGMIPLTMVIKDGKELERIIGVRSEAELEKKVRRLFN